MRKSFMTSRSALKLKMFPEASFWFCTLRRKNRVNVARVAEHFGGGGHSNAAGFTVKATFEELSRAVLEKLKEAVENAPLAMNGSAREIKPR